MQRKRSGEREPGLSAHGGSSAEGKIVNRQTLTAPLATLTGVRSIAATVRPTTILQYVEACKTGQLNLEPRPEPEGPKIPVT